MVAAAAFPSIIAGVMSTASAGGLRVVRGRDISSVPGDVVMVGVQSLDDVPGWDSAGSFDQEFMSFGGARSETGRVNGIAYSLNGAGDQAAATLAAFNLIGDLGAAIRATPTLGVTGFDYVVAQLETGDVSESQNNEGAMAALSFVVLYKTRIT